MNPNLIFSGKITLFIGIIIFLILGILNFKDKRGLIWISSGLSLVFFLFFFGSRAFLKEFFPFTDKIESFATLSFMIGFLSLIYRKRLSKKEFIVLMLLGMLSGLSVFIFDDHPKFPTPYLRTIWYPLHVPISFLSYAFWFLAAVCSSSIYCFKKDLTALKQNRFIVTELNRHGFNAFTLSMVFGGIWGYFAWGAYFLWDPKLIWSIILWFYYGNLLHIDNLPSFRKWREPMYLFGIVLVLITFIGTGFFSRSIHKF
ncbi:MAG: cytochrome c biogenesis protein CcsA [Deltaproteobacteria bacterium]|nr:cytochrome c biogenesis protein CcsA [Deltaproteobacteria bacterium]